MSSTATRLAIDLGASSGRVMAGWRDVEGKLHLQEVHRFANEPLRTPEGLTWNFDGLMAEIEAGLERGISEAREAGRRVATIGVDSWAVDFGLLDEHGELISPVFHYRDARTQGQMERVFTQVPREEIFAQTGIQFLPFNTIYQLNAVREQHPEWLERAAQFLMVADLVAWRLTGLPRVEYTNATSTQLFDARARTWSAALLDKLNLPARIFSNVVEPGTLLGPLKMELAQRWGADDVQVIAAATHDTGSAVVAVPAEGVEFAYLSSGTWSLLGTELPEPLLSEEALEANFTNEGGACGTIRFLKNIMGLWILQECMRHWKAEGKTYDWPAVEAMAQGSQFNGVFDVDAPQFLAPADMAAEIRAWFASRGQAQPQSDADLARTALRSLAHCYAEKLTLLKRLTGRHFTALHVVGGGSQNRLLCRWTADAIGRPVLAGPVEATALGNVGMQMIAAGEFDSLAALRAAIRASFPPGQFG